MSTKGRSAGRRAREARRRAAVYRAAAAARKALGRNRWAESRRQAPQRAARVKGYRVLAALGLPLDAEQLRRADLLPREGR